jgi:hypothetical protein
MMPGKRPVVRNRLEESDRDSRKKLPENETIGRTRLPGKRPVVRNRLQESDRDSRNKLPERYRVIRME